ncbi:MAG: GTP-binding protein [Chloroflexi bacterium]|nr:GTP-binding protein [Chloroflexota bacterium]
MAIPTFQRKICLLGDFAVGKTSLIRRFVYNRFEEEYLATIGVLVSRKEVILPHGIVNLLLWDLAGGETFVHMEEAYYRGAAGALVVADITRPDTFGLLNVYATSFLAINPQAALVFAINKVDLKEDFTEASKRAQDLSARWGAPHFFTSALSGEQVQTAFVTLARLTIESHST